MTNFKLTTLEQSPSSNVGYLSAVFDSSQSNGASAYSVITRLPDFPIVGPLQPNRETDYSSAVSNSLMTGLSISSTFLVGSTLGGLVSPSSKSLHVSKSKDDYQSFNITFSDGTASMNDISEISVYTSSISGNAARIEPYRSPNTLLIHPSTEKNAQDSANNSLLEDCRRIFLSTLKTDSVEYGAYSSVDRLISGWKKQHKSRFSEIIQHINLKERSNEAAMVSLLKALSIHPYADVYPYGPTIAVAALSNSNIEVRDAALRAFENWESKDGVGILTSSTKMSPPWLEKYRLDVISYLNSL